MTADPIPLQITALFLLFSACSLITYIVSESGGRFGRAFDLTCAGFTVAVTLICALAVLFTILLGSSNVVLACSLALGMGLSLLHPVAAVCFFVSLLFMRPWELMLNSPLLKALPRLMAALTTGTWLLGLLRCGWSTISLDQSSILFALLLAWIFLSTLFSITPGASIRYFFESFTPTTVLAFLILNSFLNQRDLRAFLRAFLISGIGIMSVSFYITFRDYTGGSSDFRLHSSGLWGNSNDLAALSALMLPLSLNGLRGRSYGTLISAVTTGLVFTGALLWSQSRAAQGAVLFAGAKYVLLSNRNKTAALVVAPLIITAAAIVAAAMPQRELADTSGSSESRYNYVVAGLRMARSHPVFGVGVGNYPYLYEQYTPAFIESGNRTAHSSWVLILSETGVIGLLLLWSLYGSVFSEAWKLRKEAPQHVLSMITYGIVMSFLSHTYLFLPYVFMAFILASARIHTHSSKRAQRRGLPRTTSGRAAAQLAIAVLASLIVPPSHALGSAGEITAIKAYTGLDKPGNENESRLNESIAVRGSRGETVTFVVKVEGYGCTPLTVEKEPTVSASYPLEVSLYSLPTVRTQHPSFPDARVGEHFDPAVPCPSPLSICLKEAGEPGWFLGEIAIPREHPPGKFNFTLSASRHALKVNLTVWPMVIPDKPAIPAYAELTPWFLVLAHYGQWHQDEANLADEYSKAMVSHRIIPLKSIIAPLTIRHIGTKAKLEIDLLPSQPASFRSVVLKNRPVWAYYDFPTLGANGYKQINYHQAKSYFSAIENTIPDIGRNNKALVYLWDEPKKTAFPELVKFSRLVHDTAPSLTQLVTTPYSSALESTVDIFSPVIDQFDNSAFPSPATYRNLQKHGHEVWWYVSCMSHGCDALADSGSPDMVLDRDASYIRSIGWLSMQYSIDAFLYYSVNNGFQHAPKRDPWDNLWDFSGNGDGTLFYPGVPGTHGLTSHQPVPSLRLKLWRESSYDAEYIKWMNELPSRPPWWTSEIGVLVRSTTSWSHDYTRYQLLRDRAGDYLAGLQGK